MNGSQSHGPIHSEDARLLELRRDDLSQRAALPAVRPAPDRLVPARPAGLAGEHDGFGALRRPAWRMLATSVPGGVLRTSSVWASSTTPPSQSLPRELLRVPNAEPWSWTVARAATVACSAVSTHTRWWPRRLRTRAPGPGRVVASRWSGAWVVPSVQAASPALAVGAVEQGRWAARPRPPARPGRSRPRWPAPAHRRVLGWR